MATVRQPFAELGTPRLQQLTSMKNRQNAITESLSHSAPAKPSMAAFASPTKKRLAPLDFDVDTENVDPVMFDSPSKRTKNIDGRAIKTPVSKFSLHPWAKSSTLPAKSASSLTLPSSTTTPLSASRVSPKHKRIAHLTNRRVSSPSIRRVDPPRSRLHAPASTLPFSIDAALSGTLSKSIPPPVELKEPPMPKDWFFDIHVDTPEEEAANLMEHSAAVLDISSDDDAATRREREEREERERGKENIPPPGFVAAVGNRSLRDAVDGSANLPDDAVVAKVANRKWREKLAATAMDEDRNPLGDLKPSDFYDEMTELVHVVVEDDQPEQACAKLTEKASDFASPETTSEEVTERAPETKEEVVVFEDL